MFGKCQAVTCDGYIREFECEAGEELRTARELYGKRNVSRIIYGSPADATGEGGDMERVIGELRKKLESIEREASSAIAYSSGRNSAVHDIEACLDGIVHAMKAEQAEADAAGAQGVHESD